MFIARFADDIERLGINWDNRPTTPAFSIIHGLHYVEHRISMALLQISEPGQSPDPHQRRIAVGIDLGTTHSLVAAVRNGVAECLPDSRAVCSCLRWCVTWKAAGGRSATTRWRRSPTDARNTIASAKRFMGRGLADVAGATSCPTGLSTSAPAWSVA
jgi:molecular chaperone HscA